MKNTISTYLAEINEPDISNAVWRILKQCDHEFVPPLSCRKSTISKNLVSNLIEKPGEPRSYFNMLTRQYLILAEYTGSTAGFMSFRNQYSTPELKGYNPSNYITTICINEKYRNRGIGASLYRAVIALLPERLKCDFISTRTWNGNTAHIHLLQKMDFHLVHQIENDRGPGIDTQYWAKRMV